uniref:NADH-ubiquinone oxidoreductase chain 4L n=1 Tax=Unio delphinus TaxID=461120 RepID=A0A1P8AG54_9BIVA|nr:NADH dehydrogenase subunit 4L [Unio delphinus]
MYEAISQNLCYLTMFTLSLFCVFMQRHSLLGILLGLEVISLIMCFNFVCGFEDTQSVASFVLVFLSLEVCVMCACLSLMVMFVKGIGSDYVSVIVLSDDF